MTGHGGLLTNTKYLTYYVLTLVGIIISAVAHAQPAMLSSDHQGPLSAEQLHYAVTDKAMLATVTSPAQLTALPWQSAPTRPLNLGYTHEYVWLYLRLHNNSDQKVQRLLELAYPLIEDIRLWIFDGPQLKHSEAISNAQPFIERTIKHRNPLFPITVNAGTTLDIVLAVRSDSSMQLPVALWKPEDLAVTTAGHSLLMGIYYGTLLVMLLYNVSIYINGRDIKYLWYVTYLASIGLLFACMNGLGQQYFWSATPHMTQTILITSLGSTLLFAGLFTTTFLGLANTRPYLNRAMQLVTAANIALIIAGLLLPYSWVIQPAMILTLLFCVMTIICGITRWRDGHTAAMLFTLSWLPLLSGMLLLSLNLLGWLPRNAATAYTAQAGSMIEFVLFSLALIKQLNAERQAKYAAQRSSLAFERQASESRQQALELQRQTTEELEVRVHQRTLELQALNEKLQRLSTTDPLTGLKNRRYFNERFLAEFSRSKRDGTPISVILIDIDHFKSVNDTYGHLAGDELLKIVAKNISVQAKRESDIIARHGGEEFSAVLINNTSNQTLVMAEKIRRRVAMSCYQKEQLSLRCTVSIGIATMTPQRHQVAEELLKQADDALYTAKAKGRNRVWVFSQEAA